uniref:Uncharacterized protein n=1 Tax=Cuerna arida TaxID=1464854 RepID=A0A1B6FRI0_9HEMI
MKLQKIEEDHHVMTSRVMHSVLEQTKELKDLKDKYTRLEKTQDQIHFKMKEEMAILGNENKDLDRKYTVAVEKYNMEKTKAENLEKQKLLINKDAIEIKMMIKVMEGKCAEYEAKVRKAEAAVRNLETAIRNKDVASELEGKQHRELVGKFNELKETTSKLKSELAESNDLCSTLEKENSRLQSDLSSSKAALDESVKKRNELVEELSNKTKKMNEAEVQLELMKTHTANNQINRDLRVVMEDSVMKPDLSTEIRRKDLEIEELRRRKDLEVEELRRHIASMEHLLKEKTTLEDHLRKQVADMNKQQPHEIEVTLRAQIRDLQYAVKDLTEERAGLEKIIVQKTLELDQRDLMYQQHSQILKSRDELIPLIQNRKRYDQECLERLRGFVFEHEKTYFHKEMDNRFNNDRCAYESTNAVDKPYAFDSTMVDKEMSFRQEKMTELFNLLEQKQMEMMRLERRMRDLQGAQDQREKTVREQAACISSLQKAQGGPNTNKSRGFFSLLSGQDSLNY